MVFEGNFSCPSKGKTRYLMHETISREHSSYSHPELIPEVPHQHLSAYARAIVIQGREKSSHPIRPRSTACLSHFLELTPVVVARGLFYPEGTLEELMHSATHGAGVPLAERDDEPVYYRQALIRRVQLPTPPPTPASPPPNSSAVSECWYQTIF